MAKRHRPRVVSLQYTFDSLFTAKLQQVYEILVPERVRCTHEGPTSTGERHEIIEEQAIIVRQVYEWYTCEGSSIGAITRRLNERKVPTRKRIGRWERSTVWAMLRNPAYKGVACFGKTRIAPRQRITRPLRLRGGFAQRNSANHERRNGSRSLCLPS